MVEGPNKFRILSDVITGYEVWLDEDGKRKPVRAKTINELPMGGEDQPKHFWAMVVWNKDEKKIQIMEITQKTIQNALWALKDDEDWGDLMDYDVTITKIITGERTSYQVMPVAPKPVSDEVMVLLDKEDIDLNALYKGEDPFKKQGSEEDFENLTKGK